MISLLLKRRLQRQQKGFIQMINTLTRAATLGALMTAAIFASCSTGICASAEPGPARRDQDPMPLGLHGALLQHSAGRRSFAAMPAEEHVEPVIELSKRGARGAKRRRLPRPRPSPNPLRQRPAQSLPPRPRRPRPTPSPQPQLRGSRPARRSPRSAAPAAPTIQKSAPACRPAARRRCNAWRRTRRNFRRLARRRSRLPAAVAPHRRRAPLPPRRQLRQRQAPRLRRPHPP